MNGLTLLRLLDFRTISFVDRCGICLLHPVPAGGEISAGRRRSDFNCLLRASDYLDFITIIMLAMGLIFQMPAITYVLARIGIVTAGPADPKLEDIAHRDPDRGGRRFARRAISRT